MTKPPSLYAIFKNYGKQETFTCDGCKRVLKKAWSDDDALKEMQARFPTADYSDTLMFCDDCVEKMKLPTPF